MAWMLKSLGSSLSLNTTRPETNSWFGWAIYTPHDLGGLQTSKERLWLSDNSLLKYQAWLLESPDISL
jgi:hypothetical protein